MVKLIWPMSTNLRRLKNDLPHWGEVRNVNKNASTGEPPPPYPLAPRQDRWAVEWRGARSGLWGSDGTQEP